MYFFECIKFKIYKGIWLFIYIDFVYLLFSYA